MKLRMGFVSNSSSETFICDVCGEMVSGMDMGLTDAGMYRCKKDHTFCESEALHPEKIEALENGENEEEEFDRYEVPTECCPICQMQAITDRDLIPYLLKKVGVTRGELLEIVQKEFGNYEAFEKSLIHDLNRRK